MLASDRQTKDNGDNIFELWKPKLRLSVPVAVNRK